MIDALTRHRLRNDDLHPLEQLALLHRLGEFVPEPYRVVTGHRWRPLHLFKVTFHTSAEAGSVRHCAVTGLARFTSFAANASTRQPWPDDTEWHLLPNGETHGLSGHEITRRGIDAWGVTGGPHNPAIMEYLARRHGIES